MDIPAEYAWLIPTVLPFLIGLLVGVIIKRGLKLIVAVVALVILLVAVGAIGLTFQDVYGRAMEILPNLINTGSSVFDVLPYSSVGFLIGLAIGLWKG
jgi:uncharacterized membrane protein (Fun14 family)